MLKRTVYLAVVVAMQALLMTLLAEAVADPHALLIVGQLAGMGLTLYTIEIFSDG